MSAHNEPRPEGSTNEAVYNQGVGELEHQVVSAPAPTSDRERPVSELGRALRSLSDQIAASGEKPLSLEDVQRAARDASALE